MCCWSKTNSVLRVSRQIILYKSRAVNTPRGPEGPSGWGVVTSPHLLVVKSRFLSSKKPDRHSRPRSRQLFPLFPAPALPKHVGRFQRVEITASVELWGLQQGRAGPGPLARRPAQVCECTVFPRHTACLSEPQRVPSWFSSACCVITLTDWARRSRSLSQVLPVFSLSVPQSVCPSVRPQPLVEPGLPSSYVRCRNNRRRDALLCHFSLCRSCTAGRKQDFQGELNCVTTIRENIIVFFFHPYQNFSMAFKRILAMMQKSI